MEQIVADPVPQILDGVQHVPRERVQYRVVEQVVDVPVPHIRRKSWSLLLVRSSATLVQASGDSTGGQTLRRVLLGSRVQLRTCQSGLQYRSAPTAAALIRAHSRTERRQPATSNRWLALHRLERGGAA